MSEIIKIDIKRGRVMFVISSTAQIEMFANFRQYLGEWEIKVINTNNIQNRSEMEKILKDLNFSFKTITAISLSHFREILMLEKPSVLVFGHDRNMADQLFIKTANSGGIPTLLIQDGVLAGGRDQKFETGSADVRLKYWLTSPLRTLLFFSRNDHSWKQKFALTLSELRHGSRGKQYVYGHGECTKMAVFSDAVKRMFISEGIASERIVVTGNPKFDAVFNSRSNKCKEAVCRKLGIPQDKDIVLLITSYFVESGEWTPQQRRDFVLAVAGATEKLSNTRLVIKLHPPYENENDYLDIIKGLSPEAIVCKYANLPELINASSLLITVSSTVGLEAMAAEKPVLIINFDQDKTGASFYKDSGALWVEKEPEVLNSMQKALYDPGTRETMMKSISKFVFDQAYIQDGQAAKRIANLISNMAANENNSRNAR